MMEGCGSRRWWSPYLVGILAAVLLSCLAVLNGYPLVYEDTDAYLERPAMALTVMAGTRFSSEWVERDRLASLQETLKSPTGHTDTQKPRPRDAGAGAAHASPSRDQEWMTGRSVYYGIVAYLVVLLTGLWGLVAFHGFLSGSVIALIWFRCLGYRKLLPFLALVAAVSLSTAASVFVSLTMPDILTSVMILGLAVLMLFWANLLPIDRIFLALTSTFAIISHDSNLPIAAAMILAGAVLWAAAGRLGLKRQNPSALAVAVLCLLAGVISMVAFNKTATAMTGHEALRLPHLTAHLVDLDVGVKYLNENCPEAGFAVCAYRDRFPMVWTKFLFDRSPEKGGFAAADPDTKRRLSDEQYRLALAVIRSNPVESIAVLSREAARQLVSFAYSDLDQRAKQRFLQDNFPQTVTAKVRRTQIWDHPALLRMLSDFHRIVVVVSLPLFLVAAVGLKRRSAPEADLFLAWAAMVFMGIIANAVICGVLASPYDRFQARVIWLVPFLAMLGLALLYRKPCQPARE